MFRVRPDSPDSPDTQSMPIGGPAPNTEVFVVDGTDGLVPIGVPGELLVGGAGIARGYLNRPELTTQKFVDIELGGTTRRVYRTGDLVRWLPTGDLEFLGRIDDQVKVRGFRIELGEIESRLTAHPDISSVVVIVREDSPATNASSPTPSRNPAPARNHHPAPVVRRHPARLHGPAAFVHLDAIPSPQRQSRPTRTPAPDHDRPDLDAQYTEPRNDVEATIAAIWTDVLGIDHIGIHDNFFNLGGHSSSPPEWSRCSGRSSSGKSWCGHCSPLPPSNS
ncbi:non-ribosomal peptide synthetase [Streptomyces sp. M10(2022)]